MPSSAFFVVLEHGEPAEKRTTRRDCSAALREHKGLTELRGVYYHVQRLAGVHKS